MPGPALSEKQKTGWLTSVPIRVIGTRILRLATGGTESPSAFLLPRLSGTASSTGSVPMPTSSDSAADQIRRLSRNDAVHEVDEVVGIDVISAQLSRRCVRI